MRCVLSGREGEKQKKKVEKVNKVLAVIMSKVLTMVLLGRPETGFNAIGDSCHIASASWM
jgi:hypothetical protein